VGKRWPWAQGTATSQAILRAYAIFGVQRAYHSAIPAADSVPIIQNEFEGQWIAQRNTNSNTYGLSHPHKLATI